MTAVDTEEFEEFRAHLTGVAYRMLGSVADAEDAVQEAWLRWRRADRAAIDEPRAWLTTVTGRICLDVLRSARMRRESYVGQWLPEPIVERMADPAALDPGDRAARADDISFALLAVLEKLTPEQRVAFVLHDVFDIPFAAIAEVLGSSAESARQLASRARRAVRSDGARTPTSFTTQRSLLTAFLRACEQGDLDGLLAVLAPDSVAVGDGGGVAPAASAPLVGPLRIARFVLGGLRRAFNERSPLLMEPVLVNGQLGMLLQQRDSIGGLDLTIVTAFRYDGDRIAGIYNVLAPDKLRRVPDLDPASAWRP